MELLPSKLLEQNAFETRPKIEEHMLIILNESTHEEHLFHSLQRKNREYKLAITFLTGYNGFFNVTKSKNKFHFKESVTDEAFIQIKIPNGAYEIEALNIEIKRRIIDKDLYTEADFPSIIKPTFSTLGNIVEILQPSALIGFVFDDSIGNLLGFNETILWKVSNLSQNPVDIISFDNIFIECDIAHEMIFKGKRSKKMNSTMSVSPWYKYFLSIRGRFTMVNDGKIKMLFQVFHSN